jgi:hypothetical protein
MSGVTLPAMTKDSKSGSPVAARLDSLSAVASDAAVDSRRGTGVDWQPSRETGQPGIGRMIHEQAGHQAALPRHDAARGADLGAYRA